MIIVTRIGAALDIIRLSMVYYRVVNTALFIKALTEGISIVTIAPLLAIAYTPTVWYTITVLLLEKELRQRAHKLVIGFCINKLISYFISITVFTKVAKNLGSQGKFHLITEPRAEEKDMSAIRHLCGMER